MFRRTSCVLLFLCVSFSCAQFYGGGPMGGPYGGPMGPYGSIGASGGYNPYMGPPTYVPPPVGWQWPGGPYNGFNRRAKAEL